jgi:hypothetical protein
VKVTFDNYKMGYAGSSSDSSFNSQEVAECEMKKGYSLFCIGFLTATFHTHIVLCSDNQTYEHNFDAVF